MKWKRTGTNTPFFTVIIMNHAHMKTNLISSHVDAGGPNDEDDGRYGIDVTTKERVDNACYTFLINVIKCNQ